MTAQTQQISGRPRRAIAEVSGDQVRAWDVRAAGVLDASRLAPLSAANEVLAKSLATAFMRRLDVSCDITVRSIEMALCEAFVEGAAETSSYFHLLILGSHAEAGVVQMDSAVLLVLLDCLMGGDGNIASTARDLTEIERQTAREVVRIIAEELQNAWRGHNIEVKVGTPQSPDELLHALPDFSTALVPSFDIKVAQTRGRFQLMLPMPCIAPFLKPAGAASAIPLGIPKSTLSPRLSGELLRNCFPVDLILGNGRLPAKKILGLAVGQVVSLGIPAEIPVALNIGGRAAFLAQPVRSGAHRAAHVLERIFHGSPVNSPER